MRKSSLNRNAHVRLNIMMIAVIGGLAFFIYLALNVVYTEINSQRLQTLERVHYPVIEQLRQARQSLTSLREGYAATIGLDDPLLLDEMTQVEQGIRQNLQTVRRLDPQLRASSMALEQQFEHYAQTLAELARHVVELPGDIASHQAEVEQLQRAYQQISNQFRGFQQQREDHYSDLLGDTNAAMRRANRWGAMLGITVIAILVLLAWMVSRRVLMSINESDRLKDEFLATISHELRTPMNGIIGAHSLLSSTTLNDEQYQWLEVARHSSNGMIHLIDDLLQFSEISARREAPLLQPFQLRPGVEALLESFRFEFAEKGLYLNLRGDAILDQVVLSSESKLLFVIRQLLANALKFTESGGVELSVRQLAREQSTDKSQVICQIRVSDSGPGIPEHERETLMQPFRQLDGTFSRRHQGLGIGLATCRTIAHWLGGELELSNRDQGGLQAELALPVQVLSARNEPKWQAGAVREVPPGYDVGRTVMVVEDNETSLMVLKAQLKKLGVNALSARDGLEALDLLKARPVDLILMDCQMPVMDGFEATRAIRRLPFPLCNITIVALTANASAQDRQHCQEAGMNDFLAKPVQLKDLRCIMGLTA